MSRTSIFIKLVQCVFLLVCVGFLLHRQEFFSKRKNRRTNNWYLSSFRPTPQPQPTFQHLEPCDPYQEFGHLYTADNLHDTRYIIYDDQKNSTNSESIDLFQDWVVPSTSADIHDKKFDQLDWLRNRTILMIGDSIDRNLVTHFGRRSLAGTNGYHEILNVPEGLKIATTKQETHRTGIARSPELNFTIYNWFLMGLAVQEEVPFFHPREDLPQKFEERIETLYLPLLRTSLLARPDLVVFNTGFWDLEFLARSRGAGYQLKGVKRRAEDGPTNLKTFDRYDGNPATLTELAYHRNRLRKFVEFIHTSIRNINREFGEPDRPLGLMYRTMQLGNATHTNAFSAERVQQLDSSNRMVMKEFNIPIIDWGKMTTGLEYQLSDPPIHYGIGSAQYIFGDMLLFYLKRYLLGSNDDWEICQKIRARNRFGLERS